MAPPKAPRKRPDDNIRSLQHLIRNENLIKGRYEEDADRFLEKNRDLLTSKGGGLNINSGG